MKAFHSRRHKILEYLMCASNKFDMRDRKTFELKLDVMEKRLYDIGQEHFNELIEWNSSRSKCRITRYKGIKIK